jgi:dipeptidyl aminopeptidase/acylaminoacyl peptidase
MPIAIGEDDIGFFCSWGTKGKRYYFDSTIPGDDKRAFSLAWRQARAIMFSRSRGKAWDIKLQPEEFERT